MSIITIYLPTTTGMCHGTGADISDHTLLPGEIHHHIRIQIGLRLIRETVHRTVSGHGRTREDGRLDSTYMRLYPFLGKCNTFQDSSSISLKVESAVICTTFQW